TPVAIRTFTKPSASRQPPCNTAYVQCTLSTGVTALENWNHGLHGGDRRMNTNLAYVLEHEELETALDARAMDEFLQAGEVHTPTERPEKPRAGARRRKHKPASFRDNHSDLFRPFRIY